jgi:hypothetical protein
MAPPGAPYPAPMGYAPPPKPKTVIPIIGGIFLVIAGLDGIGAWAFIAFITASLTSGIPLLGGLAGIVAVCGAIEIIFGIIALVGGIMAIMRKMWALALIGGILGLFLLGFFFFEASLFALIGLILVAISHKEF